MRSKPRKPRPRDLLVQGLMVNEARARGKSFLRRLRMAVYSSIESGAGFFLRYFSLLLHTTKSEASIKFI